MPTKIPPDQNNTSPTIRDMVESVILVLASISRNGIMGMKRKKGIQKTIKNIPTLIFQFFFFISFVLNNLYFDQDKFNWFAGPDTLGLIELNDQYGDFGTNGHNNSIFVSNCLSVYMIIIPK